MHWARRPASRAAWTAGNSKAISKAMIAMTTNSSMSVNPRPARAGTDRGMGMLRLGDEWDRTRGSASDPLQHRKHCNQARRRPGRSGAGESRRSTRPATSRNAVGGETKSIRSAASPVAGLWPWINPASESSPTPPSASSATAAPSISSIDRARSRAASICRVGVPEKAAIRASNRKSWDKGRSLLAGQLHCVFIILAGGDDPGQANRRAMRFEPNGPGVRRKETGSVWGNCSGRMGFP